MCVELVKPDFTNSKVYLFVMDLQEPTWVPLPGFDDLQVTSDFIKDLNGVRIAVPAARAQEIADYFLASLLTPDTLLAIEAVGIHVPFTGFSPNHGETRANPRLICASNDACERAIRALPPSAVNGRTPVYVGHGKEIVVGFTRYLHPDNVAIFGGLGSDGRRVQGLNAVDHSLVYYDYSHKLRLVRGMQSTLPKKYLRY